MPTTILSLVFGTRLSIARLIVMVSLLTLGVLSFAAGPAGASDAGCPSSGVGGVPPCTHVTDYTSFAVAPGGGFWVQRDGADFAGSGPKGTYAIDGAPQFANINDIGTIVAVPGQVGYWMVSSVGTIYARGAAPQLCGGSLTNCTGYNAPRGLSFGDGNITGAAATPDGQGLWAVSDQGKLFTVGTAPALGDVTQFGCSENRSGAPTAVVGTPSGNGYYILCADGGVFTFGDAVFYGSLSGGVGKGSDATGLALSFNPLGQVVGYWIVTSDGGVFSYGQAPFLGSAGGNNGGFPVTDIVALPGGMSYAWVHTSARVEFSRTMGNWVLTSASIQIGYNLGAIGVASQEPQTPIQLSQADGNISQQWIFWETDSAGVYQLVNGWSALCAYRSATSSGTPLTQTTCLARNASGYANQLWTLYSPSPIQSVPIVQILPNGGAPNQYFVAGDASGNVFLAPTSTQNPGWRLTGISP